MLERINQRPMLLGLSSSNEHFGVIEANSTASFSQAN